MLLQAAPRIFGGNIKSHLLLFMKYSSEDAEAYKTELSTAAKVSIVAARNRVYTVHADPRSPLFCVLCVGALFMYANRSTEEGCSSFILMPKLPRILGSLSSSISRQMIRLRCG